MERVINYFNPLVRLGIKRYSVRLPIVVNTAAVIVSEFFAYEIAKDPGIVGSYIIFINAALIIYFSFRDGIRGGFIATFITIFYYFYIIQTRGYAGEQWNRAIETSFVLMTVFLLLSLTIGWLKQRIDDLILQETDARQSAEIGKARLETILQQLPLGVIMIDGKNKKVEGNRYVEQLLGRKVREHLVTDDGYKSPYAFKNGKALPAKDWPLARALNNGEVISGDEIEYIRDKKHLFLRINAAPIKNKKHEILAAVSTIDDITPEKELEQRKDDFVNMASHELKTPITSMKIYIEVLLKLIAGHRDPKSTKTLLSIKNQTERLQELVSDLLDVSRIQTGKLHFNKEPFRLDALISETAEVLQGTTKQTISFNKSVKIEVNADRFRIYQVLTNLITNAIKYSPDGKKIIIQLKKADKRVMVSVKDQGIGISKEQQKKIFDRLYQVTDAKEKTFPGLGMGLYISKEIVVRHKGRIWVEGGKGQGSTFFFTLPIN